MIKRHPILWFYVFTLGSTVVLGGTGQVVGAKFVPEPYRAIVILALAQMAPVVGTFLVCLGIKDWACWRVMNWRPLNSARDVLWLTLSFVIPATVVAGAAAVMSALGQSYVANGYSGTLTSVAVLGSLTLVGCIGEEIGWRGYMLPSFNREHSLLSSAILTGILWGVWHVGKLASYGVLGYLLFILLITELSVMMAWLYAKSNKNMMCMVSFHLGVNIPSMLLLTEREGLLFYAVACAISAVICLVLVLADRGKARAEWLRIERNPGVAGSSAS